MIRKIKSIFCILVLLLVLTSCGATISQTVEIDNDFNGTKTILIEISEDDATYLEGGVDALSETINKVKPDFITQNFITLPEGHFIELSYDFNDINEYEEKTKTLTGNENFTVSLEETVGSTFLTSEVIYSESDVRDSSVQWIIDAIYPDNLTTETELVDTNTFYLIFNDKSFEPSVRDDFFTKKFANNPIFKSVSTNLNFDNNSYDFILNYDSDSYNSLSDNVKNEFLNVYENTIIEENGDITTIKFQFENTDLFDYFLRDMGFGSIMYYEIPSPIKQTKYLLFKNDVSNLIDSNTNNYYENIPYELNIKGVNMFNSDFFFDFFTDKFGNAGKNVSYNDNSLLIEFDDIQNLYGSFEYEYDLRNTLTATEIIHDIVLKDNETSKQTFDFILEDDFQNHFDLDEIINYYDELGFAVEFNEENNSLYLTEEIQVNTTKSSPFSLLTFYKSHSNDYTHYEYHLNQANMLRYYSYNTTVTLSKNLDIEKLVLDTTYNKDDIHRHIGKKDYVVTFSSPLETLEVLIYNKPLPIGLILLFTVFLFAGILLFKKIKGKKSTVSKKVISKNEAFEVNTLETENEEITADVTENHDTKTTNSNIEK